MQNMSNILKKLKHIFKYLDEQYISDTDIYYEFKKQYELVEKIKADTQKFASQYSRSNKDILYLSQLKNEYNSEKTQKEQFLRDRSSKLKIAIENYNNEIEIIENRLHELNDEIKEYQKKLNKIKEDKNNAVL